VKKYAVLALLLFAAPLVAQKPAAIELGFKADRVYDFGEIDNVNVFNGNNVITIPIGMRYPLTATFSYGLTLVYNSKVWDHRNMQTWSEPGLDYWWAKPNIRSNAGVGWRISLGRLLPPSGSTTTYPTEARAGWVYEGPSGDEHPVSNAFDSRTPISSSATVSFSGIAPYLRMRRLTTPADTSRMIEFPDGQMHTFTLQNGEWRLTRMEDRFGNFVTVTYTYDSQNRATMWTIRDSLQRLHRVHFTYAPEMADSVDRGMNVSLIELEGLSDNGTRRQYQYTFHRQTLQFPYSCYHDYYDPPFPGAPEMGDTTSLPVLTGIDLPDGSSYAFQYNATGEGCASGLLEQMTLPTKGVISYTYQLYTLNDGACIPTGAQNSTPGVRTRTADGHVTTYMLTRGPNVTPVPAGSEPANCGVLLDGPIPPNPSRRWHRTSILRPQDAEGNRVRSDHYFNMWTAAGGESDGQLNADDGAYFVFGEPLTAGWPGFDRPRLAPPFLESSQDVDAVDQGALASTTNRNLSTQLWTNCAADGSCGTLLRSTYLRQIQQPAPKVISERTLHHDDSGCGGICYSQTDQDPSSWDGVGHFRTSAMSSNFPGASSATATTQYATWTAASAANTANPWVLERYTERSRTIGTQSVRSTYCFKPDGRLERQRVLAGSAEQSTDLMTQFAWDGANVIAEWTFGGDGGGLGTQSDVCQATWTSVGYDNRYSWANGVLATSKYASPIPFFSLNYTSDRSGLVTASRGSDELPTTYDYDVWGRLRSVTPPGEVPTTYAYTNATATEGARIVATRDPNLLSTTDDVVLRYDYDRLGRLQRVQRALPGAGCVDQELTYDGLGRKSTESIWKSCGSSTTKVTAYRYDALGRVTRVTAPDGTQTTVAYTGNRRMRRTSDVGGFPAVTDEEYDAFGRLIGVTEDAISAQPLRTAYTYDVADRLITATIQGTDGDQQRLFHYDGRGLLIAEQHPELGSSGYQSTTYKYDSRGHVTERTRGALRLTYRYDAAERLTRVEDAANARLIEQYQYDSHSQSAGPPALAGKLAATLRFHYDSSLSPDPIAVTQSLHYNETTGRLEARYTSIGAIPGVPAATFHTTRAHDSLGNLAETRYPCRSEACGSDERARTVFNEFKYGTLSAIYGFASSITYQANGTIDTVKHGSGSTAVLESWTPDANGMPRPASIQATNNAGTTLWTTGTYTYDGSGNVMSIGPTRYSNDRMQRLTGWTTASIGSTSTTYLGYDSYGNRLYSQTEGCGTGPNGPICYAPFLIPQKMFGTTNHYLDSTYDQAGNLTSDGSRTFTYDPLNQVARTVVPSGEQSRDFRFLYTAGGERVLAIERLGGTNSGTFTIRGFENQLLSVFRTDTAGIPRWSEDVIWRGNAMLAQDTATTGIRHYTLDHLGSPRLITTGSTGLMVGTQSFSPFGEGGTSDGGALQFTAHERDGALFAAGLSTLPDYMHARYYDQGTGRFLSVDRVQGNPSSPQSWNRYAYARNNPIRRVDPDGDADIDFYVLMDPAKNDATYNRQWYADRLTDQYGEINGHTLRVSTDTRNAISNLRQSFGRNGALAGYFGHSEGIHRTDAGYVARGLNPREIPGEVGISNKALTSMINRGKAAIVIIGACSTSGCFVGGGLNGQTTVVALQSPRSGLTDAIVVSGALEAFNNAVIRGNGTVAEGVAAANAVFKRYRQKDQFVIVGGDQDRRLLKDQ
jgi:RHS repeat-associated protein